MHPTESTFLPAADGTPLAVYDWPQVPAAAVRATVLIVHGMGEHAGRYAALAQRLNGWGMAVRAYDQYGHGRSGGPRGGLSSDGRLRDDLARVLVATRAGMPASRPLVLLGHSMGGLVAADAVASGACQVEGLVLSSPALALHLSGLQKALLASLPRLLPNLRVHNGVDSRHLSHDPAVVQAYDRDPLQHPRISGRMARYMAEGGERVVARAAAWRTPTLLLWAGQDRVVDPAGSAALARQAPPAVLQAECFGPAFHEIFNESEALAAPVFTRLQQWLDQQFPSR
ncbi:alpha/beta hydrolase [Comamonas terrigena]|uniref:alpha/beta hydrolase n=1 Tax=Comamonas terrigena TaxID=32013 RepID=UPI00244C4863|nr:lysophospholipase [Comamonas terrigena]MDH1702434.1 lysophospholipase [Comamonas terrigena]